MGQLALRVMCSAEQSILQATQSVGQLTLLSKTQARQYLQSEQPLPPVDWRWLRPQLWRPPLEGLGCLGLPALEQQSARSLVPPSQMRLWQPLGAAP
ncbi:MAG: hypothetical protein ACYDB0_05785 [Acidithiobacillus sp.]